MPNKLYAFIPAAGFGTRMENLVAETPKPLLPVAGYPMIDFSLYLTHLWQVQKVFINAHYLKEKIERYLSGIPGLHYTCCPEETILGTAGGIKTCMQNQIRDDDWILVINPDLLLFPSRDFHPLPLEFSGDILLYLQKKQPGDLYTSLGLENGNVYFNNGDYFYTGLSVIRFQIFQQIEAGIYSDLADIFRKLSQENRLQGREFPGQVFDAGDKTRYQQNRNLDFRQFVDAQSWRHFRKSLYNDNSG